MYRTVSPLLENPRRMKNQRRIVFGLLESHRLLFSRKDGIQVLSRLGAIYQSQGQVLRADKTDSHRAAGREKDESMIWVAAAAVDDEEEEPDPDSDSDGKIFGVMITSCPSHEYFPANQGVIARGGHPRMGLDTGFIFAILDENILRARLAARIMYLVRSPGCTESWEGQGAKITTKCDERSCQGNYTAQILGGKSDEFWARGKLGGQRVPEQFKVINWQARRNGLGSGRTDWASDVQGPASSPEPDLGLKNARPRAWALKPGDLIRLESRFLGCFRSRESFETEMCQARESPGLGLQALVAGSGLGFRNLKPKPAEAGPKPRLSGRAGP
ncbi:hypothetical protein DFH06DRAFT_1125083 [Mycena polygramma]|nr:hypothetical protein DFH06DRAFT_1125083 [Mycena polygramma]